MVKIFLIPHFHYDTIYQQTFEEYLKISFQNIIKLLSLLEKYPEYKFLIEQTILIEEFWKKYPEYREKLKIYIKSGRIEVSPGMFVMPDMNLISGESLIRQIIRGKNFLRKFGKVPKISWIADCWGHHRQIPQILKKCGYKGYVFSRGMREDITPYIHFFWEGVDGTKILTYWMANGYDGFCTGREENKKINEKIREIEKNLGILKKYMVVDLILLPDGGDFVKPDEKTLKIVERWNKNRKEKIKVSTPMEYFRKIKNKNLPVIDVDFNPQFNGTYTSRIEIKQSNRKCENQLYLIELLNSFLNFENISLEEYKGKIDEIEYCILFNQFHDIICGSILDEGYYQVMEYYKRTQKIFNEIYHQIISNLTEEKRNSIAVFNQCSFPREERGILEIDLPPGYRLEIYYRNKKLPSQILERNKTKSKIIFPVRTEAFERKNFKFSIKKGEKLLSQKTPFFFKNEFFECKIKENGLISSLKIKGKELVNQRIPYFGELIFQRDAGDFWVYYHSPVNGGLRFSHDTSDPYPENVEIEKGAIFQHSEKSQVKIEKGTVGVKVEIEGEIKFWKSLWKYNHSYFIYHKFPFIDYKTVFYPDGKSYRIRVAFPTTIKNGIIRREIPFGYEFQKEGEFPAINWIDYCDDEKGIILINKGLPGNNINEGVLMLSLFRAVDMGANKARSETGYGKGVIYSFEYRIFPFIREDKFYKPHLFGISFNQPFVILPGLKWKNSEVHINILPPYIPLTLFKMYKGGYLMRVYEPEGKKEKVKIKTKEVWNFYETTIDGEQRKKIGEGREINFVLHPFEIKTLFLKKG